MAPGCDLFHARVFKGEGPQDGPTQADIINAIDSLSRDHQCDLINMSLGGGPRAAVEEDAVHAGAERGTLCICASGNYDAPLPLLPASLRYLAAAAPGYVASASARMFSPA